MYSFSGWKCRDLHHRRDAHPAAKSAARAAGGDADRPCAVCRPERRVSPHHAIDKLSGQLDVARIAGSYIFGEIGGRIVGAMICIGLVSSISAMMWIGPRVMMTMGEDIPALRIFARKSTQGAPAYAILFQLAIANLMLFTRSSRPCSISSSSRCCSVRSSRCSASSSCASPNPTCRGPIVPGIPGHSGGFPARDRLHDVLSSG